MLGDYTESLKTKPDCNHDCMIHEATGPISEGKCKMCGEVKEFTNSVESEGLQHINLIKGRYHDLNWIRERINNGSQPGF